VVAEEIKSFPNLTDERFIGGQCMGGSAPRVISFVRAGSLGANPGVLFAANIPWLPGIVISRSLRQEIDGYILIQEYSRSVDDVRWTYISPAKNLAQTNTLV
jgi:hypothetical protein